jgi:hypothetical protein
VYSSCHGNIFTEPLPRKNRGGTHWQTDGRDVRSTPLRWAQVLWYTHQVS